MMDATQPKTTDEGLEEFEGWYLCPYCGEVYRELTLCCGEMHGEEIING